MEVVRKLGASTGVRIASSPSNSEGSNSRWAFCIRQRSPVPLIRRSITTYAGGSTFAYLDAIIAGAAKRDVPTIYRDRHSVAAGGLVSYGADGRESYRCAATYVDRILKGEKAADLPVQAPTKFEPAINLKTARALGLSVPDVLLAQATEVIE